MYQLLEDVLPYFAAFFVLDSLVFAPAGELLFVRRWRLFRFCGQGPVLAGLLPTGDVLGALELPLRFGRNELAVATEDGWAFLPWKDLGPVQLDQRIVRIGGHALRLPSPEAATRAADLVAQLRDAPPARRGKELGQVFDAAESLEAVRTLRARYGVHEGIIEALGFVLLVGVFVLVPLGLAGRFPWAPDPAYVLVALLLVYAALLTFGWRTLRHCGVAKGKALAILTPMFFFPPATAHLRSVLGRKLYLAFDPLTVAAAFLPAAAFRDFARRRFHLLARETAAEPRLEEHARFARERFRKIVAEAGFSETEVLGAPVAADATAVSYCPICADEYRSGFTTCSGCGTPLEPLRPLTA